MAVEPTPAQLEDIAAASRDGDGPLVMLNLNRYRDREAYLRYARVATEVLGRLGAKILWQAPVEQAVIGEEADAYDEVIAVWYPSAKAFVKLVSDPEIHAARGHRLDGLERAAVLWCEAGAAPEPISA